MQSLEPCSITRTRLDVAFVGYIDLELHLGLFPVDKPLDNFKVCVDLLNEKIPLFSVELFHTAKVANRCFYLLHPFFKPLDQPFAVI